MKAQEDEVWQWPVPHPTSGKELEYLRVALDEADWSHTSLSAAFEQEFASFLGVRHVMLVPNGTSAVYLALLAAGIQNGQEVIVPGMTWPSVVFAILQAGGVPRTVDISLDSLCMTGEAVEAAINDRTFAVLATHIFGSQCDMQEICEVAMRHNILVIEDAAQSVGSVQGGRSCGTWGAVGAFSLNDRKVLACGEGGCVVTNSDAINKELRRLQLILPERASHPASVPGTYKVSEFQAAVALAQLEQLPAKLERMEQRAQLLTDHLAPGRPRLTKQSQPASVTLQSYFNYCVNLRGVRAAPFAESLSSRLGVRVAKPYRPLSNVSDFSTLRSDARVSAAGLFVEHANCERAYRDGALRFPHHILMSDIPTIERLASAVLETLSDSEFMTDDG
jgi:dTDP-4-amino-4,6-dideoxygalactose transaminase